MKKKLGITLAVVVLLVCVVSVAVFAGCKETVKVDNAQTATEANWSKIDNKSATTTVSINNAEIALGVEGDTKAITITASAQIDLVRTWENGVLTIDVTAKLTKLDFGGTYGTLINSVKTALESTVNLDAMTGLEFKGQVFYNYGSENKTIGVRKMSVSGLVSAIPALLADNPTMTDNAWDIRFEDGKGGWTDEVSYNLASLDLASDPTIGNVLSSVFNEGYNLDLVGIIEGFLVNQTMLDFTDSANAAYEGGHYENTVKVSDNFKFLSEVWDQIAKKDALAALIDDVALPIEIKGTEVELPISGILKQIIGKDSLSNIVPDLLAKIEGNMNISGEVENGIFTSLTATLIGAKVSLTQSNVQYIVSDVANPIITALGVDDNTMGIINQVIDAATQGTAYVSLGTITVNSTFTAA